MAVASTNAWKVDIEETIINAIRSEFKATLPVFRSRDNQIRGNQFAILKGDDSSSDNNMYAKISNNYKSPEKCNFKLCNVQQFWFWRDKCNFNF